MTDSSNKTEVSPTESTITAGRLCVAGIVVLSTILAVQLNPGPWSFRLFSAVCALSISGTVVRTAASKTFHLSVWVAVSLGFLVSLVGGVFMGNSNLECVAIAYYAILLSVAVSLQAYLLLANVSLLTLAARLPMKEGKRLPAQDQAHPAA